MRFSPTRDIDKLLGLELVRFFCALAVLVWHYRHFAFVGDEPVGLIAQNQPFYRAFGLFYDYGFFGVQFFWAISGFIFFWKYREPIVRGAVGARDFFVLRFSRLYPLHLLTLLAVALLQFLYLRRQGFFFVYQHNDLPHFLAQLAFASNWGFEQGDSFNGPVWSISAEVLVYAVFFLVLRRTGSVALNLAVPLLWFALLKAHVVSPVLECLCYFYLGGLAAIAAQKLAGTRWARPAQWTAGIALVALPAAAWAVGLPRDWHFDLLYLKLYAVVLVFAVHGLRFGARTGRVIAACGNLTYASYLLHFPLQLCAALLFGGAPMPYTAPWFFAAYMGATLGVSWLVFRAVEMPAQDALRRRLRAASPK